VKTSTSSAAQFDHRAHVFELNNFNEILKKEEADFIAIDLFFF
jgi:hypothetical protein